MTSVNKLLILSIIAVVLIGSISSATEFQHKKECCHHQNHHCCHHQHSCHEKHHHCHDHKWADYSEYDGHHKSTVHTHETKKDCGCGKSGGMFNTWNAGNN